MLNKSVLAYCIAMALAVTGAGIFSYTLQNLYPDGILIYQPQADNAPTPSNSAHIGLALGWFFALLCYSVMTLTSWFATHYGSPIISRSLAPFPRPFLAAACSCLVLLIIAIWMAG